MVLEKIAVLKELTIFSVLLRTVLAMVFSGILGYEREKKGRPAGFRTYMVVCIGSEIAMMTGIFLSRELGSTDPSRIAAQVISGIGFLGAGTILVTRQNQVKGLTTAAGLWASACMGLAIGVGFYEAAIIACFFIWLVSSALHRLDHYILSTSKVMYIYIEFGETADISSFMTKIRVHGIRVEAIEITKANVGSDATVAAVLTLKSEQKRDHADLLALISEIQGVKFVEPI